jgi:hypothetical protein
MAIVFDVVCTVSPGAHCSHQRGRSLVQTFATLQGAEHFAEVCNGFARVNGVRYDVNAVDECNEEERWYDTPPEQRR